MDSRDREIRLFFSHNLDISGNSVGDTAAFDPDSGAVVHYKGSRYFLIGGQTDIDEGLSQFAVGQKNINDKEGTFKDVLRNQSDNPALVELKEFILRDQSAKELF